MSLTETLAALRAELDEDARVRTAAAIAANTGITFTGPHFEECQDYVFRAVNTSARRERIMRALLDVAAKASALDPIGEDISLGDLALLHDALAALEAAARTE